MKEVFLVMSHDMQNVSHKEVEFVTSDEGLADKYADEMDECCTAGRSYWVEVWEVEE